MTAESPYSTLRFAVRDHVATVTLDRPETFNALDEAMARDLLGVALRCRADREIRAVVLTGAGEAFCAGGDLRSFAAQGEHLPEHLREVLDALHAAVAHLARLEAPVIASVNGVAAGAGMSLVCCADLAIAAASARFTMAYTRVGLSPDGSGTFFLPRLVGLRRALDLTLTNRPLTAQEALEWGLVTRVVADEALGAETAALAARLVAGAPSALGAAKRLLRRSLDETLETQLALEGESIAALAGTADAAEGIAAFLAKRPPRFGGS
jgi:2-(1,2-epoxy-1,2-dihydrophenyl)acetyl-CoA isomerase